MWRTARRRAWSVPALAVVISFSTNGRSYLAFASVVSIAPSSMSEVARLRMSESFCSPVRRSWRPALRCRMSSFLRIVGRRGGGPARWRAPIDHPRPGAAVLEPHPEIQPFLLEQIGDLLERLLPEILDLQDLALRLPHQIAQRTNARVLQGVDRAHRQLEVVDGRLEQLRQLRRVGVGGLRRLPQRSRRVGAELDEVLKG